MTMPPHPFSVSRSARLRRRGALAVIAAPLALSLTACGSTALRGGAQGTNSSTSGGVTLSGQSNEPFNGTGGSTGGSTGAGSSTGAAGSTGTTGSLTGSTSTGSATSGGTTGGTPTTGGVTKLRPIRLGVVGTDIGAIAAAFGKDSIRWDTSPKAVVAYINKTGGVGGRQLSAVYAEGDSAGDSNTNGQKVCQTLTQDNKVDVVVNTGMLGEVLPACLKQAGVAVFDALDWAADDVTARQYPNWITPNAIRLDRSVRAILDNTASRGLFKPGAKLGVLVENCPWAARIRDNVVKPLAKKYGATIVEGSSKCIDNLLGDIPSVQNDVQRETLRFSQSGVTHVLAISQVEAFVIAQMTQQASQQKFFPKYLVSTNSYPYSNSRSDATIKISRDAVPNFIGVGTRPLVDTGPLVRKAATPAQAASRERCRKADPQMRQSAGNDYSVSGFYAMCDPFYAMKETLEANGMRFAYADVARGWQSLLRAKTASAVLVNGIWAGGATGRLDGAGYVRPFAWDASVDGFRYIGGPYLAP